MAQGQRLNLKWTVGDVDRVAVLARKGWTAENICMELRGTSLESTPAEIINLMAGMNIHVPSRFVRSAT